MAIALPCAMRNLNRDSWAKFEHLLANMSPGEFITVDEATEQTDMLAESVQLVLEALTRASLFEKHGEHFMRVGKSDGHALEHRSA